MTLGGQNHRASLAPWRRSFGYHPFGLRLAAAAGESKVATVEDPSAAPAAATEATEQVRCGEVGMPVSDC